MLSPRRRRRAPLLAVGLLGLGSVTAALPSSAAEIVKVQPIRETAPAEEAGDAIDDPAIWVDPDDASRSVIIGANHGGDTVEVFDLASGQRLQRIVLAGANNVDLRTGFPLGGRQVPLVTVVGGGHMHFFRLDPVSRRLENVTKGGSVKSVSSHGVCMYRSARSGAFYAFRVTRFGPVDQFELVDDGGQVVARKVRGWNIDPQMPLVDGGSSALEACVADDTSGSMFVVEEEYAIWRYGAEPGDPAGKADRVLVDSRVKDGGRIVPQVEGLAVVDDPNGPGFLIASDQGDYTFLVYENTPPYRFVRKVQVERGPAADGCERTDGIEVSTADLGPGLHRGVFICQDNVNTAPNPGNQNFKLVPLEQMVPLAEPGTHPPVTSPEPKPVEIRPTPGPSGPSNPAPSPSPSPAASARSGYWMLDSGGRVHAFGDAAHHGDQPPAAGIAAVDLEPSPSGRGYWVLTDRGGVTAHGDAVRLAGVPAGTLLAGEKATSLSATPSGTGYWIFTSRGRAVPVGDASRLGDMSARSLNAPVLDSIATPTGRGYYMVAADGGIFAFGDARFFGSMGGRHLNAPVQSLVPDPDGTGYWLVAADGGVFAFAADFRGSMGDRTLNAPVTGMVPYGDGYLMVGRDGGIFNFSDRPFAGSLGGSASPAPITAVGVLPG